ncbi:MAG: hypothetical protein HZC12_01170 [Nitrospirae bacterium]|nr:hypothetical protein [Nitrospirota bacterium]
MKEPGALYQPYIVGDGLSIIFRDHEISDLIGFVYYKWDAKKAADDLIQRLYRIKYSLPKGRPFLVPIILDGENAWEHYQKDGRDFLRYLYERLSKEDGIRTVTVSEYLKEHPPEARIENLFPGSWISSNFSIWIGHEEDNLAWDMLTETREELSIFSRLNPDANLEGAWKSLYIAEGSDWCWWYGDEHTTETQAEFDELFRANLTKVYNVMGKDVPPKLLIPILKEDRSIKPTTAIRGFITPQIDGEITSYYEWYQAAYLEVSRMGGTMHRAESLMTRIYYGFDTNNLYLRADAKKPLSEIFNGMTLSFQFIKPPHLKLDIDRGQIEAKIYKRVNSEWQFYKAIENVAIKDILEVTVPFSELGVKQGDEIGFSLSLLKNGDEIEKWPWRGFISLEVPGPEFEAIMWQ